MARIIMAIGLVLVAIYAIPFAVYGAANVIGGLQPPSRVSPASFFLGVLVTKLGTAITFVAIFAASRRMWGSQWPLYAALWLAMFVLSEIGEVVSGRTTKAEALLGVVSEAIYTPLSAVITRWSLRASSRVGSQ